MTNLGPRGCREEHGWKKRTFDTVKDQLIMGHLRNVSLGVSIV